MTGREDETPVQAPTKEHTAAELMGRDKEHKPPLKKGNGALVKRLTKYGGAMAVAAVAVYGALRPEEEARKALVQVQVRSSEMADEVKRLQRWAQYNRSRAKNAELTCKADVAALAKFVAGFLAGEQKALMAARRPVRPRVSATGAGSSEGAGSIKALVKALGTHKGPKAKPAPPPLKAPDWSKFEQRPKGAN